MNEKYYVNVAELMNRLPRPTPRKLRDDGKVIELISLECSMWSVV